jgi:F-type H+-transporting ATPase subunit c
MKPKRDFRKLNHKEGRVSMSTLPLSEAAAIAGNLHVGLAAVGAAISVGLIGTAASTAVGRNPGASTKILVQSILAIAFAEAIVFYALFLVK